MSNFDGRKKKIYNFSTVETYVSFTVLIASINTETEAKSENMERSEMKIANFHLAIAKIVNKKSDSSETKFSIESDSSIFIGSVGIRRNTLESHVCDIGYWLQLEYWGKHIMSSAVNALIGFIWNKGNVLLNGIVRIEGTVVCQNIASQKVLLKCGFKKEGVARNLSRSRNGSFVDCTVFAITRDDAARAKNCDSIGTAPVSNIKHTTQTGGCSAVQIVDQLIACLEQSDRL